MSSGKTLCISLPQCQSGCIALFGLQHVLAFTFGQMISQQSCYHYVSILLAIEPLQVHMLNTVESDLPGQGSCHSCQSAKE